ncbi:MAG: toxin co-regulated pilus biosynthesis Q family protein [Rickettsiales bacterium]|jgi:hypothetical protein|nr:toxin co-regulated pilus biosynthesis Q family protein [Rickettsiales bacterium]
MKFKMLFAVALLACSNLLADSVPTWPLPGSETDYSSYSQTVKFNDPNYTPDMNSAPTNGWSGGASFTPPDTLMMNENDDSIMMLSNKELVKNFGYQTIAGSNPPVQPLVEDQSYVINDYNVSQLEGQTEYVPDQVREWVAKDGKTMREVIDEWAILEGWEVVWTTNREYPLQASAIFKGRFTDVASALTRSFGRASPPPYAKFYFGNKVLVVKTLEDENAD